MEQDSSDSTALFLLQLETFLSSQSLAQQDAVSTSHLIMLRACGEVIRGLSKQLSAAPLAPPLQPPSSENIFDAIKEERRLRSIVVERLPEDLKTSGGARVSADARALDDMLAIAGVELGGLVHFRMGRIKPPSSSSHGNNTAPPGIPKPRPLKVEFPTATHFRLFLSRASSIRSTDRFKAIIIRPSLTAEQRQAEYDMRVERRRLNALGGEQYAVYNGELVTRAEAVKLRAARPTATGGNRQRLGPRASGVQSN